MYKILFIRNPNAYLPEISAYIKYFNAHPSFSAVDSRDLPDGYSLSEFDVIWEFMGRGGTKIEAHQMNVHEYVSLSTGSLPKIKNLIKSFFNPKPDLRVFLNPNVKKEFKFNDQVPYVYRDMGIDPLFLIKTSPEEKKFDFVYTGVINEVRGMDKFLEVFCKNSSAKLLLIGEVSKEIHSKYHNHANLTFTGTIPYNEVPHFASQARYGINYIPDKYPFNMQTSTKLLEYLALGLGIVTTDYKWVREFEKKHGLDFYYLNEDDNFDLAQISNSNDVNNFDADNFLWNQVISNSGVDKILLELLEQKALKQR